MSDETSTEPETTHSIGTQHDAPPVVPFHPTLEHIAPSSAPSMPAPVDHNEHDDPAAAGEELARGADFLAPELDDPAELAAPDTETSVTE